MVSSMLSRNDKFVPLVASQRCPLLNPSSSMLYIGVFHLLVLLFGEMNYLQLQFKLPT